MTQRVTIYGYAYSGHHYVGGTGAWKIDESFNIPDDIDPEDLVSMVTEVLENEHIRIYNKDNENKGNLSYGVEHIKGEAELYTDPEHIASRLMESAEKVNVQVEDMEEGEVERNATEHREEEGEYYGEE